MGEINFKLLIEILEQQKKTLDKETFNSLLESVKAGILAELDRFKD